MRSIWIVAGGASLLVVGLGVGLWAGAVFHEPMAMVIQADRSAGQQHIDAGTSGGAEVHSATAAPTAGAKPLYHCGMHPWILQDHPGNCPICHMELTPVQGATGQVATASGSGGPAITIDPTVVQNMGVQTAVAMKGPLVKSLRTVGYLEVPETGLYDVTLKVNGYIDKLYANQTGMHLHKGEPLFDLYSADLITAEEELIAARKSAEALPGASADIAKQLTAMEEGARLKLQLLDVPSGVIDGLAKQDHASREITIRSPADGDLVDKMIVQGSSVQAGMKLLRIEDHQTLWLEAQVYEGQLPLVKVGQTVEATFEGVAGQGVSGKIVFIAPHLDHMTRTANVRVVLDNVGMTLKPGMYATVQIHVPAVEDAITVPREAVIDTGTRKITFVQDDVGHFTPRMVTTGVSGDNDQVQIVSGIAAGERVVISGQFLMDVESRTQEAIQKLQAPESPSSMPMPAAETQMGAMAMKRGGATDEVVQAYLDVAGALQKDDETAADVDPLLRALGRLRDSAAGDERLLAVAVADAAVAMKGETLAQQRKAFEKVGAAIVPLVEKKPPSSAIGSTLYVATCPMEKADWLQTATGIRNPFLTSMRTCGSIIKTLPLSPAR